MFSSMDMSLNSLDSKTSPHSWHSTNSASSSRATTRTRGCLHIFSMAAGSGGRFAIGGFWFEFIFGSRRSGCACLLTNCGYFKPVLQIVQCFCYCEGTLRCQIGTKHNVSKSISSHWESCRSLRTRCTDGAERFPPRSELRPESCFKISIFEAPSHQLNTDLRLRILRQEAAA